MATCPACDANDLEVDEFDVEEGDIVNCPECGASLVVNSLSPLEFETADDEDEDDDDEDEEDDDEEDEVDDVQAEADDLATETTEEADEDDEDDAAITEAVKEDANEAAEPESGRRE